MTIAKIKITLTIAIFTVIGSVCRLSAQTTYSSPTAGYYYISNVKFPTRYLTPNTTYYAQNQPYLWTDTEKGGDAIWEIRQANGEYHNIIHTSDGKYIIYNGEGAQAVHLETTNNPGNNGQFRFRVVTGSELAIIPRSASNQNSGYNNSLNPYEGETGIIGLYRFDNDQASRWLLTRITAIEPPAINVNTNTGQCTLYYQGAIPADIHYTLDGTDPTASSASYSGTPFTMDLSRRVTIKAIAISTRYTDVKSDIGTYTHIPVTDISNSNWSTMTSDGNYRLTEDITTGGNILSTFTGTLDGNYHTISGLTQPLFGTLNGGTVKNLIFSNINISGSSAGAVCGIAAGSAKVYNCGVLGGSVSASQNAGGLVGTISANSNVRVVNCYNYANISGGTYAAGIVGRNQGTISGTTTVSATGVRITNCMMYGDITGATNRSPVYGGNHSNNVQKLTEYNYYRSRANLTYTEYNDQLAIDKDEFLTRFPFYRHIQNTHREMAAYFLFGEKPSAAQVAEIGHWVLKPDVAPYPIIEPWQTGTHRTTQDIRDNLPATAGDYAGKLINSMGNGGYLTVSYTVSGTSGSISLPITDMDTLRYDYTWGKVVLPFANELWTQTDYSKVVTGWKITSVTKNGTTYTSFSIPAAQPYNFADRDNPQKDIYDATNNPYIFAQGGNYIVPYGVTAIRIEANLANAFYLSDARSDLGYNTTYGEQTSLAWAVPTTYHDRTVYTNLSTLVNALASTTNPHQQAIVLVGNYHYNQAVVGTAFNIGKACTIMSIDDDCNQEPDYGWYSYHTTDRTNVPALRFDFVPNIGMGMAQRITGSTPYPTIGIWHARGWFELTETSLSLMSECEINDGVFSATDNGHGNNRWIANSGYFIQIVRARSANADKLSYLQIGGNAYVKELYPGSHTDNARTTTLCPVLCTGGEIEECYMTGYNAGASATGSDIRFWGAGGKIHKWLGAYMERPVTTGVNVTARIDHARIYRFFGGGTSSSARITGNIDITMNNSLVDFYCGGPEFGDMAAGKTVTTHATGSTFGEYYGAGFGGTSITYNREGNNASVGFGGDIDFPIAFGTTYKRLTDNSNYGTGSCYKFEFILYAGGSGTGVARSYTGYAQFSLATTGSVTNVLDNCTVKGNFYGAGCQGKVNGTVSSTLTECTLLDNAFGGGYKATSNTLQVYPAIEPAKSRYTKETGLFSDFGTIEPETFTWQYRSAIGSDDANHILYTNTDMSQLGNVTGAITLSIKGGSVANSVFGGGNESPSNNDVTVVIDNTASIGEHVYGGGNIANVGGATTVSVNSGTISGSVYGGGTVCRPMYPVMLP